MILIMYHVECIFLTVPYYVGIFGGLFSAIGDLVFGLGTKGKRRVGHGASGYHGKLGDS